MEDWCFEYRFYDNKKQNGQTNKDINNEEMVNLELDWFNRIFCAVVPKPWTLINLPLLPKVNISG